MAQFEREMMLERQPATGSIGLFVSMKAAAAVCSSWLQARREKLTRVRRLGSVFKKPSKPLAAGPAHVRGANSLLAFSECSHHAL